MLVMNSQGQRSRFLLLPEVGERPTPAKQAVLRRYSLSRLQPEPTPVQAARAADRPLVKRRPA
jgi:hypothetical protein